MKNDILVLKQLQLDIILLHTRLRDLESNLLCVMNATTNSLTTTSTNIVDTISQLEGKKFIQISNTKRKMKQKRFESFNSIVLEYDFLLKKINEIHYSSQIENDNSIIDSIHEALNLDLNNIKKHLFR